MGNSPLIKNWNWMMNNKVISISEDKQRMIRRIMLNIEGNNFGPVFSTFEAKFLGDTELIGSHYHEEILNTIKIQRKTQAYMKFAKDVEKRLTNISDRISKNISINRIQKTVDYLLKVSGFIDSEYHQELIKLVKNRGLNVIPSARIGDFTDTLKDMKKLSSKELLDTKYEIIKTLIDFKRSKKAKEWLDAVLEEYPEEVKRETYLSYVAKLSPVYTAIRASETENVAEKAEIFAKDKLATVTRHLMGNSHGRALKSLGVAVRTHTKINDTQACKDVRSQIENQQKFELKEVEYLFEEGDTYEAKLALSNFCRKYDYSILDQPYSDIMDRINATSKDSKTVLAPTQRY